MELFSANLKRKFLSPINYLVLLILFGAVLPHCVVAQNQLVFIHDHNLLNALSNRSLTTNDSLDLNKIEGLKELNLFNENLSNIDDLKYFASLKRLNITSNQINDIDNLPPNIVSLNCSKNKIEHIKKLPSNLKYFICNSNGLRRIDNFPDSLISIQVVNNLLKKLPQIPNSLEFINYSQNPIVRNGLPEGFRDMNCTDNFQNCLPYQKRNWDLFGAEIIPFDSIEELTIRISNLTRQSKDEPNLSLFYVRNKENLVLSKLCEETDNGRRSGYMANDISEKIPTEIFENVIDHIQTGNLNFRFSSNSDSLHFDLSVLKDGDVCSSFCEDCDRTVLKFEINTEKDKFEIDYSYEVSAAGINSLICTTSELQNVKKIMEWLYMYQLVHLLFPENDVLNGYFSTQNLKFLHGLLSQK